MPLNNLQRIFYQSLAEKRLLEHEGQAFEDFFVEIGRRRWGDDFEPIRAYGKHGDLKCDGRRISTGTLYQCYGPRTPKPSAVHEKIKTDFDGAHAIWGDKLKGWSIVVNDRQGPRRIGNHRGRRVACATSRNRHQNRITCRNREDGFGAIAR